MTNYREQKLSKRSENQVAHNLKRTIKIKLKRSYHSRTRRTHKSLSVSEMRSSKRESTKTTSLNAAKTSSIFKAQTTVVNSHLMPRLWWKKWEESWVTKNIIRNLISFTDGLLSEQWLSIIKGFLGPTWIDGESSIRNSLWLSQRIKLAGTASK